MTDVQSRNSSWSIRRVKQENQFKATEYFDGNRISKIRKITQRKTQTKIEIELSQRQESVCDVLEGCDDIQITENEVLYITKEENTSHTSNRAKLTMEDKENLYAIAFLGEKEERENNSSLEKSGIVHSLKRKNVTNNKSFELLSSHGCLTEQGSVLEALTEILGISQKDSMEWKEKLATRNTVVSIKIHEGKVGGDSLSNEQMYYCKVGLVSIRDMKTKSRLDDVSSDVRTTNSTQSMGELIWNESFALMLGNETGLCIEVWNECTVLEKSKKKPKCLEKTLVGQSIVELGSKKMKKISFPINSQNGKNVIGQLTLSVEVIDPFPHSDSDKYSWYQKLLCEAIEYEEKNIPSVELSLETVCTKMAKFLKLNEFEKTAAKWSNINEINDNLESNAKLEVDLIILNSQWDSQVKKMEPLEQQALLHDIHRLYVNTLDTIKFRFPPRNENALSQINQIFGILLKIFLFLKDRDVIAPTEDLKSHIINKIKEGVYSWYARTEERIINKEPMQTYVNTLHTFCQHIIKFIQMLRKYYPGQSSVAKIDISQIAIVTIDPLLAGEVEMCVQSVSQAKASDELIFSMFSIERKIKLLIKEKNCMKDTNIELHIDFHVEWFRQFINKWLDILKNVSVEYLDKVIKYETSLKDIGVGQENLSSSAYDIAICLYPNYCFHAKMQEYLDTANRIHFSFQVVLLIQETLMRYIQIMGGKISQIVDGSEKNGFKLTTEICQIFNNIHFVKEYLEEVPRKLNTISGDVTESDTRYQNLIKEAEECLGNEKSRVLSVILPHFHTQIKQYLRNLTSKENLPVEDAISDLMEWLVANIQICTTQLTQAMFNELLEVLWDLLLDNIYIIISDKQTSCNCHQQIFRAINILYDFFYNDGEGLSLEKIKKELFKNILQKVQLEMINSYDLMLECVREFANTNEMKFRSYGKLTFSMVYYEDRCILETNIMKVENIYNPSFTGKCKPIIEVSIVPRSLNFEVALTKFFKSAEDIYINEVLHISIPKDKFSNIVVKISLYFRYELGLRIREECYSGSIHVEEKSIGRGANNLKEVINETDNNIGSLVKRNFIYPFQEDSEKVKILRKRTDSVAQGFLKEMVQEQKKEQSLNKYQSNVNATKKFFKKN